MKDFETIYQENVGEVFRFARWLCRDATLAEDLVAETFLRAWRFREAIATETLRAYLLRITRNLFLETRRRQRGTSALEETLVDPGPGPERTVEARLQVDQIGRLLSELPEIDQSAFRLRVMHELSYEEIARVLGISTIAARVKVHRARSRIIAAQTAKE